LSHLNRVNPHACWSYPPYITPLLPTAAHCFATSAPAAKSIPPLRGNISRCKRSRLLPAAFLPVDTLAGVFRPHAGTYNIQPAFTFITPTSVPSDNHGLLKVSNIRGSFSFNGKLKLPPRLPRGLSKLPVLIVYPIPNNCQGLASAYSPNMG
jgi:hypothetical protein